MLHRRPIFIRLVFSLIMVLAIVSGCKKKDKVFLNQAAWSSKEPVSIPLLHRKHQSNPGNLVFNPSFETGKIYYEKSKIKSFDVNGWKKVGDNVEWVDINSNNYSIDEVYDGTHAIKIVRKQADEIEDLGVGIISDYIKVIPGNYALDMFLKLENICPNQARLGTKLYDAVNIRLLFFDKNKIQISSGENDPFRNTKIDIGFKSFNLSNYWNINKFGWGRVDGQSAKFPFLDGDIPDDARYVKIFIGLKGIGKMWVDKVNFAYTDDNFTFLERLKPYFDSSFSAYELLIPEPKQITKLEPYVFYDTENPDVFPEIYIPQNADEKTKLAAQKIKENLDLIFVNKLEHYQKNKLKIKSGVSINSNNSEQFIISVGATKLFRDHKQLLPDTLINGKQQGYFIYQIKDKPNIIFLYGEDPEGNYNSALTFNQLIDENEFLYYSANIIDFPDFVQRGFLLHQYSGSVKNLQSDLDLLNHNKFNQVYFEAYEQNQNHYPFKNISTEIFESDVSILIDLLKFDLSADLSKSYKLDKSIVNQKTDLITNKILTMTESGHSNVLIKGDYKQPYDPCSPELVRFITNENISLNLQNYHTHLLQKLSHNLNQNLEFMSPWNRLDMINMSMGQAEFYYRDLTRNIPDNISLYWTGGSYCSSSIDYAEWNRMYQLIKTKPILFDNSLNYSTLRFVNEDIKQFYSGKMRVLSLFEPYKAKYPHEFYKLNQHQKILVNIDSLSRTNLVKALTASNYFWNTGNYNADKTAWKVLVKLFGTENAQSLIYFNDAYYGLTEMCQKLKSDGLNNKNIRIAGKFETDLDYYFEVLDKSLADRYLFAELEHLKNELITKYNSIISTQNY